jgi:hypothetical protein
VETIYTGYSKARTEPVAATVELITVVVTPIRTTPSNEETT